jgi:hypothetical protein
MAMTNHQHQALAEHERLIALMGLVAQVPEGIDSCPSDEQLADFVSGGMSAKNRRIMLAHLDRCQDCYYAWLEIGSYLGEQVTENRHKTRPTYLERIRAWTGGALSAWQVALPAAAALLLLGAFFLMPATSNLQQLIDREYAASADLYADAGEASSKSLPLPWDNAVQGFNQSEPPPEKQAFGAGLWAGKHELAGIRQPPIPALLAHPSGKDWDDTEWKNYFEFGKWAYLMQTRIRSGYEHWNWENQRTIWQALHQSFFDKGREKQNKEALAALERLQAPIQDASSNQAAEPLAALNRRFTLIIYQLAP